jgi:hypothetical protein
MNENPEGQEKGASGQRPLTYVLWIVIVTAFVTPIALPFYASAGDASRILPPGVLMLVVSAVTCSALFILCPSRPRWGKITALVLTLPSLFLAVYGTMWFLAFDLGM